jgi:hypothetical protein
VAYDKRVQALQTCRRSQEIQNPAYNDIELDLNESIESEITHMGTKSTLCPYEVLFLMIFLYFETLDKLMNLNET